MVFSSAQKTTGKYRLHVYWNPDLRHRQQLYPDTAGHRIQPDLRYQRCCQFLLWCPLCALRVSELDVDESDGAALSSFRNSVDTCHNRFWRTDVSPGSSACRGQALSEVIATFGIGLSILELFRYLGFVGFEYTLPVFFDHSFILAGTYIDMQRILIVV